MDKMKKKAWALAMAAMVATTLAKAEEQAPASPDIKATATVPPGLDLAADKNKTVYVEFLGSKRLTDEVRAAMRSAGFSLADSKDAAEVRYELDGGFQALRPGTGRTAEVRAGDYAEDPKSLKTKTGRGASVMVSFNPLVMLFGTIFSNVGDRAGTRDAVNESTTGDPDGKCLAKCEVWIYKQRAVVNLARSAGGEILRASASTSVDSTALAAAALLEGAGAELARATGVAAFGVKP